MRSLMYIYIVVYMYPVFHWLCNSLHTTLSPHNLFVMDTTRALDIEGADTIIDNRIKQYTKKQYTRLYYHFTRYVCENCSSTDWVHIIFRYINASGPQTIIIGRIVLSRSSRRPRHIRDEWLYFIPSWMYVVFGNTVQTSFCSIANRLDEYGHQDLFVLYFYYCLSFQYMPWWCHPVYSSSQTSTRAENKLFLLRTFQ